MLMQSSSNLQKNTNDTYQSEAPAMLDKYNKSMIENYQKQIKDGTLTVEMDPDLNNLDFIRLLNLNKLVLKYCEYIIPKLESSTIKQLELTECYIQSVKDFQLENLEVLVIRNSLFDILESKTLAQEITMFYKLKELILQKCITDFSPLSQMTGLTKLSLIECNLHSTEALRPLINLEKLILNGNDIDITTVQYLTNLTELALMECNLVNLDALRPLINLKELHLDYSKVDITSVQYLTNLTNLSLGLCNLVNIDVLRPLKKLKVLDIYKNKIVYLQPLIELKQLSTIDVSYNKIIDTESIQLHPNFNNFILYGQKQPTQEQLEVANMMRNIQNTITFLKQINKKSSRIKEINTVFRQKINQQLQDSYNSHEQFVARVAQLFQKTNVFDGCQ
ncbi:leucine-rich_repeat protein [Hexamita inflata]|uniref:Leucine-rich repeat protein n=1 Tax=Hexamita inflata TaxID=28002 RepID=A0AA86P409_9EUKA|nr:leucine-rich repeat protein [Hexamita inflata]